MNEQQPVRALTPPGEANAEGASSQINRAEQSYVSDVLERLQSALADKYEIERELGRGGMSVVYLAHDVRHDRKVALKMLRPELSESVGSERFLREIRIAASLEHPNIVPLFDSGDADGLLYYVMPYVRGQSLRDLLQHETQVSVERALEITNAITAALEYAHRRGVVHRDIKPENVLLADDRIMVADFGIARAASEADQERLTATGVSMGTAEYMSPEQATADRDVDARSDIYSLGVVLYEMLAGDPPFTGRTRSAIVARVIQDNVPSLEVVRKNVQPGIVKAVKRALEKVPGDRFATAADFARAVELGSQEVVLTVSWGRRNRTRIAVVATALVALSIVVGVWRSTLLAGRELDSNRVTVFPLAESNISLLSAGIGEVVGQLIGSALEQTEPLRWLDGSLWLGESQLDADFAASISRERKARHYVTGSVVEYGDSARVILRLYDILTNSEVAQRSAAGLADPNSVIRMAMTAIRGLLPLLLERDREVDLAAIEDRDVSAVALWMMGNTEFRHSRFAEATSFYNRALALDSTLAMAALMAAKAADFRFKYDSVAIYIDAALANAALLPERHLHYARGLSFKRVGRADSAIGHFRLALSMDPQWTEAWLALAETYRYLVLDPAASDSARAALDQALALDPEFTPAMIHLAERLLSVGETARAEQLIDRFKRVSSDTARIRALNLRLRCVRDGSRSVDWEAEAALGVAPVIAAAAYLAESGLELQCAEDAYRSVLQVQNNAPSDLWGTRLGLQTVLFAQRRYDDMRAVLDEAESSVIRSTTALYMLDAAAGAPVEDEAAAAAAERCTDLTSRPSGGLWLCGLWADHRGDTQLVGDINAVLDARTESAGSRLDSLVAARMQAYSTLAMGDTTGAVQQLSAMVPSAGRRSLRWDLWESMGAERLKLAQILFAQKQYAEALRVAGLLDHPQPVLYLLYLPESLRLRVRIADAMGDLEHAAEYRGRLMQMGAW